MHFEVHLFCALVDERHWYHWCSLRGWKASRMLTPSPQCFVTRWFDAETLELALAQAKAFARQLRDAGFPVSRLKIEANLRDPEFETWVPGKAHQFWEFHWHVAVPDWKALEQWAEQNSVGLSLSSTSLYHHPMVTLRCHSGTRDEALQRADKVQMSLLAQGWSTIDNTHEEEVNLYDSSESQDVHWL